MMRNSNDMTSSTLLDEKFSSRPEVLINDLFKQSSVLFNAYRIAIMVGLYNAGAADFPQLKRDLNLSDGALATHMKALRKENLIKSKKELVDSRLRTTYIITKKGIKGIEKMFEILCDMGKEFQIIKFREEF